MKVTANSGVGIIPRDILGPGRSLSNLNRMASVSPGAMAILLAQVPVVRESGFEFGGRKSTDWRMSRLALALSVVLS